MMVAEPWWGRALRRQSPEGVGGWEPAWRDCILASRWPHALWPQRNLTSLSVLRFWNLGFLRTTDSVVATAWNLRKLCPLRKVKTGIKWSYRPAPRASATRTGNHQYASEKDKLPLHRQLADGFFNELSLLQSYFILWNNTFYPDNLRKLKETLLVYSIHWKKPGLFSISF